VPVRHANEWLATFRSILYFDEEERDANGRPPRFADPAVRALFASRFGTEKLAGGGELTSVATGLAPAARQRFGD